MLDQIRKERAELVVRLQAMLKMRKQRPTLFQAVGVVLVSFLAHTCSTFFKYGCGLVVMLWVMLKHLVLLPLLVLYVWFDGLMLLIWFFRELRRV